MVTRLEREGVDAMQSASAVFVSAQTTHRGRKANTSRAFGGGMPLFLPCAVSYPGGR